MDASRLYALLRFEEAALALRAVMQLGLVEEMGDQAFSDEALRERLGFTSQSARTFFALLEVMGILKRQDNTLRISPLAAQCLADGASTSRKPYLSLGTSEDVESFVCLMQGRHGDAVPLYSGEGAGETVMDDTEIARAIAYGLASRARNFAEPLAKAIAEHASNARTLADIGAGSPYVAHACLRAMPNLQKATLVDRANGMRFARELVREEQLDASRIEFLEGDFFAAAPPAEVFVVSNTAHDWRPDDYALIAGNLRAAMPEAGIVCIHEPILTTSWANDTEWLRALWMACYALTLLRLTLGQGTCYRVEEHNAILSRCGLERVGVPVPTNDGCTALFYRPTR